MPRVGRQRDANVSVCLVLCRSSILPSAFTQPICIREDTEYLSFGDGAALPASRADTSLRGSGGDGGSGNAGQAPAAAPGADETGPLPMYEDTQFLTGPSVGGSRQPSGELGARGGNGGGSGGGGGDDTTGLLVREDTCFLPDAPVAGETKSSDSAHALPTQSALLLHVCAPLLMHRMHPPSIKSVDKHQIAMVVRVGAQRPKHNTDKKVYSFCSCIRSPGADRRPAAVRGYRVPDRKRATAGGAPGGVLPPCLTCCTSPGADQRPAAVRRHCVP